MSLRGAFDDRGEKMPPKDWITKMNTPLDPEEFLRAVARLTLRQALPGCMTKGDNDPDSWNSLEERLRDLLSAYVRSEEGLRAYARNKEDLPDILNAALGNIPIESQTVSLMSRLAGTIADTIADVPSIQAAVATHFASQHDNDP